MSVEQLLALSILVHIFQSVTFIDTGFLLTICLVCTYKQVDPSAGGLAQVVDPHKQHGGPNHFASGGDAILPNEGNGFFSDFQQGIMGFDGNMNAPDPIGAFLNQAIADPDEHSSTTSNGRMPPEFEWPQEFECHGIMQVMIYCMFLPADI